MSPDNLGDRMKVYESVPKTRLMPKTPGLIRLDGRAFHTLTKSMDRPFDPRFQTCMWQTAKEVCQQVSGVQLAYVQSDEITLLLADWATYNTQGWFDYDLQKIVSVSAGIASVEFGAVFREQFPGRKELPVFDSRAWNLPAHEVTNCFIWRQQDATRNSIQMLARAHFSHKELHKKSTNDLQDMLVLKKGINWNDQPTAFKRGVCVVKKGVERQIWQIDTEIPIFTQDREYIDRYLVQP